MALLNKLPEISAPSSLAARATVLAALQQEHARFVALVSDPADWVTEMNFTNRLRPAARHKKRRVCDIVGHMTQAVEAYSLAIARARAVGDLPVGLVGSPAGDPANDQPAVVGKFSVASSQLRSLLGELPDAEWTNLLVPHPSPLNRDGELVFDRPFPAGHFASFALIDVAVHIYDVEVGRGNMLATLNDTTAGIMVPFVFMFWARTVDRTSAQDGHFAYAIEVGGACGGRWRAILADQMWTLEPSDGDYRDCAALFRYETPSDLALTFLGRFPGGSASGDPDVIKKVRDLFYPY